MELHWAKLIPWLPLAAAILCGICAMKKSLRSLAAFFCVLGIATAFAISLGVYPNVVKGVNFGHGEKHHAAAAEKHGDAAKASHAEKHESVEAAAVTEHAVTETKTEIKTETKTEATAATQEATPHHIVKQAPKVAAPKGHVVKLFTWIETSDFKVDFAYYLDPLTMIMLFVITGIGTLVAVYAAGYMKGDKGYARFFAFVGLFIFAMTNLVMANNLVLMYLGWEGVGLCSYLLIGYYYNKPSAVAAAKKAFIVNRIGDLGFALGIFLTFYCFNTVDIGGSGGILDLIAQNTTNPHAEHLKHWIPYLLMLGAFGKSAQLPLYVWLPDAMEGPTPVSALIHAATMVTAGVYMIARLFPLFMLSPGALMIVSVVGGLTALFAATIALCQYDIKRIYAYSTISQLGYMFMGVGAMATVGGAFHLFTHAFFKALLFLTAGSVMHALAGQLDLRKMSGLRHKMPVTCWMMFAGCLALAGVPGTAGFFSKDMILAHLVERGLNGEPIFLALGVMGLFTAFLTAYYTFRLWFRVFMGPEFYEMGHEHHSDQEEDHGHADAHGHDHAAHGHDAHHAHAPHEMPFMMNAPLLVLTAGALLAGILGEHWMTVMINHSSAAHVEVLSEEAAHASHHIHVMMMIISGIIAVSGILLAAVFHWWSRPAADRVAQMYPDLVKLLENKYYIDELNDTFIVSPLRVLGDVFFVIDRLVIDGLVGLVGFIPRVIGLSLRPMQGGVLQGYGLGMITGVAIVVVLLFVALH